MAELVVGSTDARCLPLGIVACDGVHAVKPTDYHALCGTPVVFVFLEREYLPGEHEGGCPRCEALAVRAA